MRSCVIGLGLLGLIACGDGREADETGPGPSLGDAELVLYSSLSHESVVRIADAWREASGVTLSFLIDEPGALIQKMADKEHYPGADLLLLTDSVSIAQAVDQDVLRPVYGLEASTAPAGLPADADGYWRAVGVTADLIVAEASMETPSTYAELGEAMYKDKLCLRRGIDPRSVALVASMTERLGARDAELAVRGWRYNQATAAFDTEAELLAALAAGDCSIAIVDSRSLAAAASLPASLQASFPADETAGAHVHPLALGVSRHARDPETAGRFVAWLLSPDGQAALQEAGATGGLDALPERMRESLPYFLYEDARLLIERARYR